MCGINGIFAYGRSANRVDRAEILRTRDHMAARGPDAKGVWLSPDETLGFGHRRLSIIDLSETGAQPMRSDDGRFVITFNGEIYNYRELRQTLELKGYRFLSRSDTEVLLHLYADKGAEMVRDLRGMFAFAIWDSRERALFLARDPYGIKPLYYSDDGKTIRFASQVKALLAGGGISRDADPAGQVGFYLYGSVPEPFTTFRDIRSLPAGATLTVGTECKLDQYHSIARIYADAEAAMRNAPPFREEALQGEVRQALIESVRHHLVADVPVGAFLSAGIDSGTLVGLMRDAGHRDLTTVTLSFEEYRGRAEDEAPLASQVAALYGTRHTTRIVGESEFKADLPNILHAMDQPSIDGVNTWFVAKAAHELGLKVAVSGVGGDELFGGYPSFQDIPKWVRWLRVPSRLPFLGKLMRCAMQHVGNRLSLNPKMAGMLELGGNYCGAYVLRRGLFMPWELEGLLEPDMVSTGLQQLAPMASIAAQLTPFPAAALHKVAVLEASLYMRNQLLRDTDWASMAHSLEVRTPLVDSVLLQKVAACGLPSSPSAPKAYLAAAPTHALPRAITHRAKTGFGIPIGNWMSRQISATGPSFRQARAWAQFVGQTNFGGGRLGGQAHAELAG